LWHCYVAVPLRALFPVLQRPTRPCSPEIVCPPFPTFLFLFFFFFWEPPTLSCSFELPSLFLFTAFGIARLLSVMSFAFGFVIPHILLAAAPGPLFLLGVLWPFCCWPWASLIPPFPSETDPSFTWFPAALLFRGSRLPDP